MCSRGFNSIVVFDNTMYLTMLFTKQAHVQDVDVNTDLKNLRKMRSRMRKISSEY